MYDQNTQDQVTSIVPSERKNCLQHLNNEIENVISEIFHWVPDDQDFEEQLPLSQNQNGIDRINRNERQDQNEYYDDDFHPIC